MKLTTRARYGTRAVIDLASNYGKGPVFLHEIAEKEGVSEKYLQHLFHSLKVVGLIKSERGVGGGFSLAKDPSTIRLSELVTVLEGPLSLVECVDDKKACSRSADCVTRELWKKLSESMMKVLDSMTLDDLVRLQKQKEGQEAVSYQI